MIQKFDIDLKYYHSYLLQYSYFSAGIFGFIGISIILIPLNYITAPPPFADNSRGTLEATAEALIEIGSSSKLLIAVIGQFTIFLTYFLILLYL